MAKLDEVEEGERRDDEEGGGGSSEARSVGKPKGLKGKGKGKVGAVVKADTLPSKHAIRVEPKVRRLQIFIIFIKRVSCNICRY